MHLRTHRPRNSHRAFPNPALLVALAWWWAAISSPSAGAAEVIGDPRFRNGFILWEPKPGAHVRYGEFRGSDPQQPPTWGLSQWSSRFPLPATNTALTGSFGQVRSNTAKAVVLGRPGSNAPDLSLAANSGLEYGPKARQASDPWVHLLVEQEFETPAFIDRLKAARFHLEARLASARNRHHGDESPSVHAAQFQVFFTLQNRNRQSPGFGDLLWFGIPIYDNRHRHPPEYKSRDFGGTGKFIFTPAGRTFTQTSAHDGNWVVIDTDLLPLLQDALKAAWNAGFLAGSKSNADYAIGGMNMGWELPGSFDVRMDLRNLSLTTE